ncbi:MAG: hypothetical protein A3G05_02535 [Candidatus Zambryskibacteria bacterium RIFCSPLOWO2_12_FULL_45_14]|uniref:Uncharacterized protein n=2 Tax=Candidatus Zambryskiibacteriota TaxID=1817925 RepID=A0A1G2UQ87_9BACT|nr:MAG: hypothetical protein A3H60_01565 [Candidatus Zambryskibacteria bacterium RIFCSPLOWO2_02_FULL_44_12b]OHB13465.1 MAG: hypothetical protein A3G05_02535 [Candidatus Zambryskibacteria bacterium RIFCSPLOWO2_12_FULL_45_14]
MSKKNSKSKKPKDRFDEIRDELVRHMGMLHEQTKHDISLIAEQVAHNTEQISKLSELVELMRYELKLKADNVELISLSHRVTILERKLMNRK